MGGPDCVGQRSDESHRCLLGISETDKTHRDRQNTQRQTKHTETDAVRHRQRDRREQTRRHRWTDMHTHTHTPVDTHIHTHRQTDGQRNSQAEGSHAHADCTHNVLFFGRTYVDVVCVDVVTALTLQQNSRLVVCKQQWAE